MFARFMRWCGRALWAAILWVIRLVGQLTIDLVRGILRQIRRTTFGNFRRGVITCAIASLMLAAYFPQQTTPIVAPLWSIGFSLLGIYIMLYPIRLFVNGGGQQRRRRRD